MNDYSNEINQPQTIDNSQNTQQNEPPVNPGAIRKSTTQSILKAASQASGMEFDSVETMAAAMARMSAQLQQLQQSQQQPTQQQQPQQDSSRVRTSDLQEQFMSLKQDLAKKEQALREKELDTDIRSAMGDTFDPDLIDYALTKVRGSIQWEDGSYTIVNSKGQVRYGEDGSPLTLQGLVREVAQSNPKLLKRVMPQAGSGIQNGWGDGVPGDGEVMPDYTKDPAAFNRWAQGQGLGRGTGLKGVRASVFNSTNIRKTF